MPRRKPDPEPEISDLVDAERERVLAEMPEDRDLTDAETQKLLRGQRKHIIANLIAMSHSKDQRQREWATRELLAQDMGKAGTKKRSDADEIGVIIMSAGKYGIPAQ